MPSRASSSYQHTAWHYVLLLLLLDTVVVEEEEVVFHSSKSGGRSFFPDSLLAAFASLLIALVVVEVVVLYTGWLASYVLKRRLCAGCYMHYTSATESHSVGSAILRIIFLSLECLKRKISRFSRIGVEKVLHDRQVSDGGEVILSLGGKKQIDSDFRRVWIGI